MIITSTAQSLQKILRTNSSGSTLGDLFRGIITVRGAKPNYSLIIQNTSTSLVYFETNSNTATTSSLVLYPGQTLELETPNLETISLLASTSSINIPISTL